MTANISSFHKNNKSAVVIFSSCILLFAYVVSRAYLLGITWDEAFSYFNFTDKGIYFPVHFDSMSANNHLLNTWLTGITTGIFGLNEFTLRIPVLFFYLMYLFFTYKMANEFTNGSAKVSVFIILNVNPYLVDFFSLSRGYGLSYGLLAGSLWYLYCYFENNFQRKYSLLSIIFAALAVLAHLTLIHFLLSLFLLVLSIDFFKEDKKQKFTNRLFSVLKKNIIAGLLLLVLLLYIIPVIYGLSKSGAFFYGGNTGFLSDTFVSIFDRMLYEKEYSSAIKYILSGCAGIILVMSVYVILRNIFSDKYQLNKFFFPSILILLFACSVASVLQNYFLNTLLLTERTALYLLVLFTYVLVFLFKEIKGSNKKFRYVLPVIALFGISHFANSMNLKYVVEWNWDADVKEMISDIGSRKDEIPLGKSGIDLGLNLEFEAPVNFYRSVNGLTWLNRTSVNKKNSSLCDFYLYKDSDMKNIDMDSFIVLKTYPLFNSKLLERKHKPLNYEALFSKKIDFDSQPDSISSFNYVTDKYAYSGNKSCFINKENVYSGGIKYPLPDTLMQMKNCIVTAKVWVLMEDVIHADANLVISFDRDEKPFSWNPNPVQEMVQVKNKWTEINFTVLVPQEIQQGDVLKVYATSSGTPVHIDDLEVKWLKAIY